MNIDVYGTNTMLILARRGYSNPPRVVRHYNNAIVLKEKNCYKIARDRTGDERADRQRGDREERLESAAATNGCRHVSCHFDGNAMDVRYFV